MMARSEATTQNEENQNNGEELDVICRAARRRIVTTAFHSKSGHIASSLSAVEILTTVCSRYLNVSKENRLILSKGHAALGLYSCLVECHLMDSFPATKFGAFGSELTIHAHHEFINGVVGTTGSLGHGLSFGAGLALAQKIRLMDGVVFVVMGDGECQEGQVWEAALFASSQNLSKLVAVVDKNDFQSLGSTEQVVGRRSFNEVWAGFGWNVYVCSGNNVTELQQIFQKAVCSEGPSVVIANTVKGSGISFMEGAADWHYRLLSEEEFELASEELS